MNAAQRERKPPSLPWHFDIDGVILEISNPLKLNICWKIPNLESLQIIKQGSNSQFLELSVPCQLFKRMKKRDFSMEAGGTVEAIELLSNHLLTVVWIWHQHGFCLAHQHFFPLVYMLKRPL